MNKHSAIKRIVTATLSAYFVVLALSSCQVGSGEQGTSGQENTGGNGSDDLSGLDEGGVTQLEGLPITSEEITLTAVVKANALFPEMENTNVIDALADKTNIRLDIRAVQEQETLDLMFTSGEFPDLVMRTDASANQVTIAIDGGYFEPLEPLLEEYAPTWYQYLQDNPLVYNSSLATDGKLYGLPYIDFDPTARNLRDQWIIMDSWLKELSLDVPETTEAFKDVLVAFKQNAGSGTIPEDVIPFYFLYDSYIGGQFDLYGSFGVYVTSGDYLFVDDGVVIDQSTNPAIKEPLKYLNELYTLGLIPPEVFTDDWNSYVSKITSDPAIVGSYSSYANRQIDSAVAMRAPDSGNGSEPLMRSQAYTPAPTNVAIISADNKYPVATTRLFEVLATDSELGLTVGRGIKGIVWDYDEDNKAYYHFWEEDQDKWNEHSNELGFQNSFVGLFDTEFYENTWKDINLEIENSRTWAYYNVYENATLPNESVYVAGPLSTDETNTMNQYGTDLSNHRRTVFADFITGNQDIDTAWDSYVAEMQAIGLEAFVDLKQAAYDLVAE